MIIPTGYLTIELSDKWKSRFGTFGRWRLHHIAIQEICGCIHLRCVRDYCTALANHDIKRQLFATEMNLKPPWLHVESHLGVKRNQSIRLIQCGRNIIYCSCSSLDKYEWWQPVPVDGIVSFQSILYLTNIPFYKSSSDQANWSVRIHQQNVF
jgi:hypothetical protein